MAPVPQWMILSGFCCIWLRGQSVCLSSLTVARIQGALRSEPSEGFLSDVLTEVVGPQPLLTLRLPAGAPAWTPLCYQLHTRCFSGYCGKTARHELQFGVFSDVSLKTNWRGGGRERKRCPSLSLFIIHACFSFICAEKKQWLFKKDCIKAERRREIWSIVDLARKRLDLSPPWPDHYCFDWIISVSP